MLGRPGTLQLREPDQRARASVHGKGQRTELGATRALWPLPFEQFDGIPDGEGPHRQGARRCLHAMPSTGHGGEGGRHSGAQRAPKDEALGGP